MDLWNEFLRTVEAGPERPAFIRGDEMVSFEDWAGLASEFAGRLVSAGVVPGDRVLVWVSNSPGVAAAIVGGWAAGCIVTLMDSGSPPSHLEHALARSGARVVVYDAAAPVPRLPEGVMAIPAPGPGEELPASQPAGQIAQRGRVLPTDPASIVFTSGSTGKPKGVTQSHGNLIRGCRAVASYLELDRNDRILCGVPWSFDYGYGQLLSSVLTGAAQVLPELYNPVGICRAVETGRPTVLAGVPSLFTYLLRGISPIRETELGSLRLLTNSGGTIPAPLLSELRAVFSGCRLSLNYGLTETYRTCTLPEEELDRKTGSVGKPIPGVDVVIVRDDGSIAGTGEEGEIVHRGDYVCLGYWADPEATARAVRPDPLAPGSEWGSRALYTGDYGYLDEEGFLYFKGRRDHQLKSMGVRVSPAEVEEILHRSGLVSEVAAFGIPHELLGHEVWAAVVPAGEPDGLQQKLMAYARQNLSVYMQPRRYLIKDGELPRTPNRKTDYVALKAEATGAAPSALGGIAGR